MGKFGRKKGIDWEFDFYLASRDARTRCSCCSCDSSPIVRFATTFAIVSADVAGSFLLFFSPREPSATPNLNFYKYTVSPALTMKNTFFSAGSPALR